MIQRILHSRHFLACLLSAATGMVLYFRAPFPEDNIFLRVIAIRSASAFLFFKYSYTLFLDTTPYIAYSILLSGIYIFALKAGRKIRAGKLPLDPAACPRSPNVSPSSPLRASVPLSPRCQGNLGGPCCRRFAPRSFCLFPMTLPRESPASFADARID